MSFLHDDDDDDDDDDDENDDYDDESPHVEKKEQSDQTSTCICLTSHPVNGLHAFIFSSLLLFCRLFSLAYVVAFFQYSCICTMFWESYDILASTQCFGVLKMLF